MNQSKIEVVADAMAEAYRNGGSEIVIRYGDAGEIKAKFE